MRATASQMPRVFVSYRRRDTQQAASALRLLLVEHLTEEVVFLDREDLDWGQGWQRQLDHAIVDRDVIVCLIGPEWEGDAEHTSSRRIDDPEDPVRREIALAIATGLKVLPVLVDRADIPDQVPGDIRMMFAEHATPLRSTDYESDFAVILAALWRIRLEHVRHSDIVLRVGSRPVHGDTFLEVLEKKYPPEVRLITLAATGRVELTLIDAKVLAPHLYLVLAEDADERDRRVVAALAPHWDSVTVVAGGTAGSYSLTSFLAHPDRSWLRDALDGVETVELLNRETFQQGVSGLFESIRRGIAVRPRAALLLGAVVIGGGAALAIPALTSSDSEELLAALMRAADIAADDEGSSPLTRWYYKEVFPCEARFVVDRLGPTEIEARSGVTAASVDSDLAAGNDALVNLDSLEGLVVVDDESSTVKYDFDFYEELIDARIECRGGLVQAWKLDEAARRFLDNTPAPVADAMEHVDCVFAASAPSDEEMRAVLYYWYYENGGLEGPLTNGPERFFSLSGGLSDRTSKADCDRPS